MERADTHRHPSPRRASSDRVSRNTIMHAAAGMGTLANGFPYSRRAIEAAWAVGQRQVAFAAPPRRWPSGAVREASVNPRKTELLLVEKKSSASGSTPGSTPREVSMHAGASSRAQLGGLGDRANALVPPGERHDLGLLLVRRALRGDRKARHHLGVDTRRRSCRVARAGARPGACQSRVITSVGRSRSVPAR